MFLEKIIMLGGLLIDTIVNWYLSQVYRSWWIIAKIFDIANFKLI